MYRVFKRIIDLFIASVALLVFSPLLIPVMIILKLTGEGEVFYLQERVGQYNKPFHIWKFATMLKDSPTMGTGDVTVKNDPRVLPFGQWLRKTKINELPQVLNVILGSMSIVGARPLMSQSFEQYPDDVKRVIYDTPPGITGIGSIIFRDEESILDNSEMPPREFYEKFVLPYKGEVEVWYQKNKSTFVDLMLIFITAWVILFPNSNIIYRVFKDLPKRPF